MLPLDDIREKLLTQRRNLLRQVAQIEAELPRLEPDVESRVQAQGEGGESGSVAWMNAYRPRSR
jgi:hypothetical protein